MSERIIRTTDGEEYTVVGGRNKRYIFQSKADEFLVVSNPKNVGGKTKETAVYTWESAMYFPTFKAAYKEVHKGYVDYATEKPDTQIFENIIKRIGKDSYQILRGAFPAPTIRKALGAIINCRPRLPDEMKKWADMQTDMKLQNIRIKNSDIIQLWKDATK